MEQENLFLKNQDLPMVISWNDLIKDKEYKLEFCLLFEAPQLKKYKKTLYITILVKSLLDQESEVGMLYTGDYFFIHFPELLMTRAWVSVPYIIRKQVKQGDNIIIDLKIKKKNAKLKEVTIIKCLNVDYVRKYYNTIKEILV